MTLLSGQRNLGNHEFYVLVSTAQLLPIRKELHTQRRSNDAASAFQFNLPQVASVKNVVPGSDGNLRLAAWMAEVGPQGCHLEDSTTSLLLTAVAS